VGGGYDRAKLIPMRVLATIVYRVSRAVQTKIGVSNMKENFNVFKVLRKEKLAQMMTTLQENHRTHHKILKACASQRWSLTLTLTLTLIGRLVPLKDGEGGQTKLRETGGSPDTKGKVRNR